MERILRTFIVIPNVIKALSVIQAHPGIKQRIKNNKYELTDVRSTILSYLIFSDALTSFYIECPEEIKPRIEWLGEIYESAFPEQLVLLEESE
jgi:hypothetical protein